MEKEVSEVERKRFVKKKYTDKINSLLSQDVIVQREMYSMVRGFFSEFLKLEYEFTYEELSSELNKIFLKSALKKDIDDFLYDLSESEYFLEKDLEPEQVREFVVQFQNLVKSMIYDSEVQDYKPSFFEKLFKHNKTIVAPLDAAVPASEENVLIDDGDNTISKDVISNIPIRTVQSMTSSEDIKDVSDENAFLKQKLFQDHSATEINSNTQDQNILLNFDSTDDDAGSDFKSDVIKSGSNIVNVIDENKESKKTTPKVVTREVKKDSKKVKSKVQVLTDEDKSEVMPMNVQEELDKLYPKDSKVSEMPRMRLDINKKILKNNNLLVEDNSPDMVSIHECMEESYLHMNNSYIDDAKRSYLKALDIYHKLSVADQKLVYDELYMLFRKLKPL